MLNRRKFVTGCFKTGIAAATAPLWGNVGLRAFGQVADQAYKAVVVIELAGGNDSNNMLIPMDSAAYADYASIRGPLAVPIDKLLPLQHASGEASYGLHPILPFVQQMYNNKKALFAANVGPIKRLASKSEYMANPEMIAPSLYSHPSGVAQWGSALTTNDPGTGWGGRLADVIAQRSGTLPPVLNTTMQGLFTAGNTVQAVAVQSGATFAVLPPELNSVVLEAAKKNSKSNNPLVAQAAQLKVAAMQQQVLIDAAQAYRPINTDFYALSGFSQAMKRVALTIAGRSVIGASRQIFFVAQGNYDSHQNQWGQQWASLDELNHGLESFYTALEEIGMQNDVLVCTISDFSRTYAPNVNAGTDHGWGSHQLVMGGDVAGGRLLGQMPTLELNGPDDANGLGAWIPSTSVTQFAAGVGSWMGLNSAQMTAVFPELPNYGNRYSNFTG